ncbi:MAG: DUF177 domain-containing protein [Acidimicrobiia bacterium]
MSDLRIDVADLLTHPGSRRPLVREAAMAGLGGRAARVAEQIRVDLVLERVPGGLVARGTINAHWSGECSVCLVDLSDDLGAAVSELFEERFVDGETYPLLGHEIDLEQLVRDAVLLELPLAPTCESTGAPPCRPVDVNDDADDGAPVDPRWAALSELEL